jgi:hypothetical protein
MPGWRVWPASWGLQKRFDPLPVDEAVADSYWLTVLAASRPWCRGVAASGGSGVVAGESV